MQDTNTKNREIEARFLVCGNSWRGKGDSVAILQGYLSTAKETVLRMRIQDDKAVMTVKGETVGLTRKEYEFSLDDLEKAKEVIPDSQERYFRLDPLLRSISHTLLYSFSNARLQHESIPFLKK